jgi:hypothetical protein
VNAFKQLPWQSLFLAALLAVIIVKAFDYLATKGLSAFDAHGTIRNLLITGSGELLLLGCGGLAIGGLGVLCLERFGNVRFISVNLLWALILCLMITFWLLSKLDVPGIGIAQQFSETHLIGIVIGVFWKGQRYWRRF